MNMSMTNVKQCYIEQNDRFFNSNLIKTLKPEH